MTHCLLRRVIHPSWTRGLVDSDVALRGVLFLIPLVQTDALPVVLGSFDLPVRRTWHARRDVQTAQVMLQVLRRGEVMMSAGLAAQ